MRLAGLRISTYRFGKWDRVEGMGFRVCGGQVGRRVRIYGNFRK